MGKYTTKTPESKHCVNINKGKTLPKESLQYTRAVPYPHLLHTPPQYPSTHTTTKFNIPIDVKYSDSGFKNHEVWLTITIWLCGTW